MQDDEIIEDYIGTKIKNSDYEQKKDLIINSKNFFIILKVNLFYFIQN